MKVIDTMIVLEQYTFSNLSNMVPINSLDTNTIKEMGLNSILTFDYELDDVSEYILTLIDSEYSLRTTGEMLKTYAIQNTTIINEYDGTEYDIFYNPDNNSIYIG
jgi:hypothetical protein